MAQSLGMKVSLNRVFCPVYLLFGCGYGFCCGMIGFVGLVVPHISRLIVGSDHKALCYLRAIRFVYFVISRHDWSVIVPVWKYP